MVLIFLLPIFTLTSERGGKVAGMNFPVFSKQGKGHFAFFFKVEFSLRSSSYVTLKVFVEAVGSGHSLLHHVLI